MAEDTKPRHNVFDLETASRPAKLELRLWLRMLTCTALVEKEVRARLRSEFAMTLPQFDLMAQLNRNSQNGLTMGVLGNRMMVSAGNITGITDRLERDGYVVRVRSDEDRRSQRVELTALGREYFKTVAAAHHGWISAMFENVSRKDQADLFDMLGHLKHSVQDHHFKANQDGD